MLDPLQVLSAAISTAESDLTIEQLDWMREYQHSCEERKRRRTECSDRSRETRARAKRSTLPAVPVEKVH